MGPQIRQLLHDERFEGTMNDLQLEEWKAFRAVCEELFSNHRSPNFKDTFQNLLHSYELLKCKISLKIRSFPHVPFEFLPRKLGQYE